MTSSPAAAWSQEQYFAVSLMFIDRAVTFAAELCIVDQMAAFKLHEHHLHQINNKCKGNNELQIGLEREKEKL